MIAYLDLPSGISGDMLLGCLVDGGWPLEALRATVEQLRLPPGSWQVAAETVMRGPLRATRVSVNVVEGDRHRHLHDICMLIGASGLPSVVQERAIAVFTRLAQAEAAVHGTTVEEVHFHEVGALDAIVDITGVCMGLHALGVEQLYASSLPLGEGWTMTAHGRLPLPAPATLALLAAVGAPTRPAPGPGELVTPTGAALLAELAVFRRLGPGEDQVGGRRAGGCQAGVRRLCAPGANSQGASPPRVRHGAGSSTPSGARRRRSAVKCMRPLPV